MNNGKKQNLPKPPMKMKTRFTTLIGSLLTFISPCAVTAQTTLNWTGGSTGGNANFTSTVNWSPSGTAPGNYAEPPNLVIASRNGTDTIPTLLTGSSFSVRSLTFDNSAGRFNSTTGLRLGPTTSTTSTAANVLTFATPDINIMSAVNNAAVTLNRFTSSASQTYALDYTGLASIAVDASSSITFSEVAITGSGGLIKTGAGSLNFNDVTSTLRNFSTGGFQILDGTVSTNSNLALGEYATLKEDAVVINGGTLSYTNTAVITNSADRGMQVGENTGTIELTNGNLRLANNIGDVTGQAGILRRTGVGILAIEAGTSHTGGTLLESGQISLAKNSTLGGAGGAGIVVSEDAILRGSGTINGHSTFGAGSILMIDQMTSTTGISNIIGTLTINGNLTVAAANFMFDLNTPNASDLLDVTGTIDIGAGVLDLNSFVFTTGTEFSAGTYTLFGSDNLLLGSLGSTLTGTLSGYDVTLGFSDDGTDLVLTAIPEPAAALLGGLGMLLLLRRRTCAY